MTSTDHYTGAGATEQPHPDRSASAETTLDRAADLDHLDLAALSGATVEITQPVRFGNDLDADLRELARLRDATSYAIQLTWTLAGNPLLSSRDFSHLVPPSASTSSDSADVLTRWRRDFRYGTFYYRVGPGFVTIKDVRPGADHARMTISGGDAERFLHLAGQSRRRVDDGHLEAALEVMDEVGLARCTDSTVIVLPFRIRHWPVPFLAI